VVRKKYKFKGKSKYKFFTKFAIGADKAGLFNFKARLVKPYNNPGDQFKLDVIFYDEESWEKALSMDDCTTKRQVRKLRSELSINGAGDWSDVQNQFTISDDRTRMWYVAVADCEGYTHGRYSAMPKIEFQIDMKNGGSHFSEEENGTLTLYSSWESPLLFLMVGILADLSNNFFNLVHNFMFMYDGEGFFILTVFGDLSYMSAQVIVIWLLLMIGYGWTIKFKTVDEKDIYVIILLFVLMIHLMIVALVYVDNDEYHKYHNFSGIQGFIIVVLRLIMLAAY
jgi:hypothetical protein